MQIASFSEVLKSVIYRPQVALTEEALEHLRYLLSPKLDLHHLGIYFSICIIILLLVRKRWLKQLSSKEIKFTNPYVMIALLIFSAWYVQRYITSQVPLSYIQTLA
jgi:hypothetical protein